MRRRPPPPPPPPLPLSRVCCRSFDGEPPSSTVATLLVDAPRAAPTSGRLGGSDIVRCGIARGGGGGVAVCDGGDGVVDAR